ncbi:copper amine oxidase N-terminal domain-containing protein [Paenibacillus sp. Marseille-Q4541]|uniref:copper amine oxidase N-terminal domain-containing protein n=1 Tax=Paenibacillus sp. Marseille-Q4541 TaxID=2831522 RepID=UPI001BA4637E|nr:copper amine oxidase N-terminal domain-containing protein [Paenibacillus sp. Marseille-Q4541]
MNIRRLLSIFIFLLAFSSFNGMIHAASSNEAQKTSVTIKDSGVILKNTSMVPIAPVLKNLGGTVQLNNKTKEIAFSYGNTKIKAKLDSRVIHINGVKSSYAVAPQIINGKLMVPIQLIKDLLKATIAVEQGTYDYYSKYIKSITVTVKNKSVTIPINDLYESYQKYIGKSAWINVPFVVIEDLYGNNASDNIKNLAQVKITNVTRDDSFEDWINVHFFYKGKTYIAMLAYYNFDYGIHTVNPRSEYNFSQKAWELIGDMRISTGMTPEMVYLSWGPYNSNSKDVYNWGTSELWVYEGSSYDQYLYFFDDVLQSISTY